MAIKMLHHVCIQTDKYKESLDFYTNILGFKVVQESKNFHTRDYNTWIKSGEFMIELQTAKSNDTLNKWSSLNRGQQVSLARSIAGRGQYSRMMALFDNWDQY